MFQRFLPLALGLLTIDVAHSSVPDYHDDPPQERDVTSPFVCVTNGEGFFGEVTQGVLPIEYYYSVITNVTLNETQSSEGGPDLLTFIEIALAEHLLASEPFKDACNPPTDGRMLGDVEIGFDGSQRRLAEEVVGMTVNPLDLPLGVPCATPPPDGSFCEVIYGGLFIYTTEAVPGLDDEVRDIIKEAMNAGTFDNVHPNLEKVEYIDDIDSYTTDPSTGDDTFSGGGGGGTNNRAVYISAGIGSAFVLGGLAFYRRRQASRSDKEDASDPSTMQEV